VSTLKRWYNRID